MPRVAVIFSAVIELPHAETTLSSMLSPSRIEPSARRPKSSYASSDMLSLSPCAISFIRSIISDGFMRLKSNLWHLDKIV